MLTDQERAKLKALVDAAARGPWRVGDWGCIYGPTGQVAGMSGTSNHTKRMTAQFVAASREAVPALLADLEDAERTISRQQTAIDGQVSEINTLKDDRNSLLAKKFSKFNGEECWIWQGDGEDHLESLVCPVVIAPTDLMAMQAELAATRQQLAEAQATLTHLGEYWNRDENEMAMKDACWHVVEVVESEETSALQAAIELAIAPYKKLRDDMEAIAAGSPTIPFREFAMHALHDLDNALSAEEKNNG